MRSESSFSHFMSKEQTSMIQAAACICIILHHVTQQATSYLISFAYPVTLLNNTGFIFTSLFFFFSGFGLLTSLQLKPDYLDRFLCRRLPAVLIPFWMSNLLGVILHALLYGMHSSLPVLLCRIFGLLLINGNGWFFVEIVFLYLLFYVLFRFVKRRDTALFLLCAAVFLLILYSFSQGHDPSSAQVHWFRGEWWYNSTAAFLFGLLFSRFYNPVKEWLHRYHFILTAVSLMLFIATFCLSVRAVNRYGYYHEPGTSFARYSAAVTLLSQTAVVSAFILLLLLLHMRFRISSRPLAYLRSISRELLLIHGYFNSWIFASVKMPFPVRFLVVLASSIAASALFSPVVRLVTGRVILLLTADKTRLKKKLPSIKTTSLKGFSKTAVLCLAAFTVLLTGASGIKQLLRKREAAAAYASILQASVGDEVCWGRFETNPSHPGREKLTWIVVEKNEDSVRLLCRDGIAGSWYHQKHAPVSWQDSDLRAFLKSGLFENMFIPYEKSRMLTDDGDLITLLTVQQAMQYFRTDDDRRLAITEAARAQGTNVGRLAQSHDNYRSGYQCSWWWLKGSPALQDITAPIVTAQGKVETGKKYVNKPGGAIRPVIRVKL